MTDHYAITGASSGLGREMAVQLAKGGARVSVTARRAEKLAELAAAHAGRIEAMPLDVTDAKACEAFVGEVLKQGVNRVILNAGITAVERFTNGTDAADEAIIATNVTANLRLIRALSAGWIAQGVSGRILIVASLAGLAPLPYQAVYSGTKAFMLTTGLALREELAADGIGICIFAPGGIKTEMTDGEAFSHLSGELAPVDQVARAALKALADNQGLNVPGAKNKLAALATRLLPRGVVARTVERTFRKSVEDGL